MSASWPRVPMRTARVSGWLLVLLWLLPIFAASQALLSFYIGMPVRSVLPDKGNRAIYLVKSPPREGTGSRSSHLGTLSRPMLRSDLLGSEAPAQLGRQQR